MFQTKDAFEDGVAPAPKQGLTLQKEVSGPNGKMLLEDLLQLGCPCRVYFFFKTPLMIDSFSSLSLES